MNDQQTVWVLRYSSDKEIRVHLGVFRTRAKAQHFAEQFVLDDAVPLCTRDTGDRVTWDVQLKSTTGLTTTAGKVLVIEAFAQQIQ